MHRIVEFAKNELGTTLYPGQAEALSNYYQSGMLNWLFLAGRRGGKSLIADIIACYEAVISDLAGMLRAGEERFIIIVSVRQENANLHIKNISNLLRHTRPGRALIRSEQQDRIELTNGVTILSLPASARAGRGFTASLLILDELAHFVDSMGNSSADAVYDAFSPVLATFGDAGRLVITTTPMSRSGIVYDLFDRATQGELDDYYVTKAATRELNPRVSERVIKNAEKRDPESAAVEYGAEFAEPLACYFSSDAIERAIDDGLREARQGQSEHTYYMAIDPATQRDRYAFCIVHREEEITFLDYAIALHAPVDPNEAEALLVDLVKRFNPSVIRCDTASTVQRLKLEIRALEYTPFTRPFKLAIYGATKEAMNLGRLVLYRQPELIEELKHLQIRNNNDIAAPRSGRVTHDDLADCLALCVEGVIDTAPTWWIS